SCRIDLEIHAEKFSEDFLIQKDLLQLVFEWYNIFRDSFNENYRNKALNQVLRLFDSFSLTEKETKVFYTICRHWGMTKTQFEEQYQK
ncbi:MAG: hypothetical protein ABL872_11265, partial [Lacibacter sp.]